MMEGFQQRFRRHGNQSVGSFSRPQKRASSLLGCDAAAACPWPHLKRNKPSRTPKINIPTQHNQHWRPVAGTPAVASSGFSHGSSPPHHCRRKRQLESTLPRNKRVRVSASAAPNPGHMLQQPWTSFDSPSSFSPFDLPPCIRTSVSHKRQSSVLTPTQQMKRTRREIDIDGHPSAEGSTCTDMVPAFPFRPEPSLLMPGERWTFTQPLMQSELSLRQPVLTDRTPAPIDTQIVRAQPRFESWLNREPKEPEEVLIEIVDDGDGGCTSAAMDVEDDENTWIFNID